MWRNGSGQWLSVHRPRDGGAIALGVALPPETGCCSWKKRGAPDRVVCTALVTAMGWRCTG